MPDYSYGIQHEPDGRPFLWLANGRKSYISPVAMQTGERPPDTSGFWHSRPQWSSERGRWEQPFDWGKAATIATIAAMAAPVAIPAIAGLASGGGAGAAGSVGAGGVGGGTGAGAATGAGLTASGTLASTAPFGVGAYSAMPAVGYGTAGLSAGVGAGAAAIPVASGVPPSMVGPGSAGYAPIGTGMTAAPTASLANNPYIVNSVQGDQGAGRGPGSGLSSLMSNPYANLASQGASAAANMYGARRAADSARDAGRIQEEAAERALQFQRERWGDMSRGYQALQQAQAPFLNMGQNAASTLQRLLTPGAGYGPMEATRQQPMWQGPPPSTPGMGQLMPYYQRPEPMDPRFNYEGQAGGPPMPQMRAWR